MDFKLQHDIQKTHVKLLDSDGKDDKNYAAALRAKLNFDKIARKNLMKFKCEEKMLKHGANENITLEVFAKDFEKEFIPEFTVKVFDIIYDFNSGRRKGKKKKADPNKLGVGGDEAKDDEKEEVRTISRMDAQRFIKSSKAVRKHIREKSLVPIENIFQKTQFTDMNEKSDKVTFDEFKSKFEETLGKEQCQTAFDLMKNEDNSISIEAYNEFRDKGVHKLLGEAGKEVEDDGPVDDADNGDDADANADADDGDAKENADDASAPAVDA